MAVESVLAIMYLTTYFLLYLFCKYLDLSSLRTPVKWKYWTDKSGTVGQKSLKKSSKPMSFSPQEKGLVVIVVVKWTKG